MANGDLVRFRQGSRADVVSTAKQAGQLLFATYEDEVITTSGAESFVQGDIYFDLSDGPSGIRVNLANDVDKARTLFSGQTSTSDTAGNWTATIDGITKLYDGLTIVLRLNTSYNSTYNSLNVNGLGAKLVWYRKGSRLTSHVPSGSEVLLVYRTVAGSYTTPSSGSRADIPRGTTCTDGWILLTNYVDGNTVPSAYCSTNASTAAKTASCSGYSATANTYIHIVFSNTNTANVPTLNINSKGAKPIYLNGEPVSSSNKNIIAGSYIAYYDGTAYYLRNDGILPGRIENAVTANNATLAAEATKLQTGGTLQVDLSRTTPSSLFDGTGNIHNIGVNGILDLDYGGTNAVDGAYTDNMLTYVSTVSNIRAFTSASQLYTTGSNLGVNKTSVTSGYSLDVSGKSLFDDIVLNSGKTIKVGTLTLGGNTDALSKTITSSSTLYLTSASGCSLIFSTGSTEAGRFDPLGHFIPGTNNTFNLGSSQKVWKKLFVYDIEASNAITTGGLTTSGDVSFTGQGFNYSGIQAGSFNSSTPIWFASATANGTPVYDSDFTYNPSTNTLTVGIINGADTNGGLGLYGSGKIYLRPNSTATAGVELNSTTFIPATTNTISLGDSNHRWSKLYIGTADTYGANDIPIWWNNGKPEAITTLNPLNGGTGVQNLTAFRALYFDSVFKVSSNIIINPASDYQIETTGITESTVFSVDKKVELRYNASTSALDFVFV